MYSQSVNLHQAAKLSFVDSHTICENFFCVCIFCQI